METFKTTYQTDITASLQKSLNDNKSVVIDGQYIISDSLVIPDGGSLIGINGASIKCSNSPKGLLKSRNIYINITGKSSVTIEGINFIPADNYTDVTGWACAIILLQSSKNCKIKNNTFGFKYNFNKGSDAVWITQSNFNLISNNICKTVGITNENGSSYNTIQYNEIYNANANALGNIGNSTATNTNNIFQYNYIEDAGRMGIEDQQNTSGTLIFNNTINGSGKSGGDGIAISAVGTNTVVSNNRISKFTQLGIEIAGKANNRVIYNDINDVNSGMGIIANFTVTKPGDITNYSTLIQFNKIVGTNIGIQSFGSAGSPDVWIDGNTIIDALTKGVTTDWGNSVIATIKITNNTIVFNNTSSKTRVAISMNSSIPNGSQEGNISIVGNTINYAATANIGIDYGLIVSTDNTLIQNNILYGYKKGKVYPATSNGTKPLNVTFSNNVLGDINFGTIK